MFIVELFARRIHGSNLTGLIVKKWILGENTFGSEAQNVYSMAEF